MHLAVGAIVLLDITHLARIPCPADLGTRPGLHGQTLVSSGHAELDKILGGGLPLGSLLLILEDGSSRHHATLLRYFLAEGAACGQVAAHWHCSGLEI